MINADELEVRWYKYKSKRFTIILITLNIIALLVYGGYYILFKLDFNIDKKFDFDKNRTLTTPLNSLDKNITCAVEDKKIEKSQEDNVTSDKDKKESDIISLSPIIPIVDGDSEKQKGANSHHKPPVKKKYRRKESHIKKDREHHTSSKLIKAKESDYLTPADLPSHSVVTEKVVVVEQVEHKKRINFKKTTSNYMSIMKEKFKNNKNPREALLIAKAYYRAGNYEKAEEWSLKANSLDKGLEESWILFAKSKNALGKRREALKILIPYYNQTKSDRVKSLIDKISSESI